MSWFALLGIAVVIATVAALTGLKPKGTRPVAHTRLMGMARLILVVASLVVIGFAVRGYLGR